MPAIRICLIGNSHLVAIKHAWDAMAASHADIEATFFAAPGRQMNTLEADSEALFSRNPTAAARMARSSGGSKRIEFADYDVFVLHGLHQFPDLFRSTRRAGLLAGLPGNASQLAALIDKQSGEHVLRLLTASGKPVICSPSPLVNEKVLAIDCPEAEHYRAALGTDGEPTPATRAMLAAWNEFLARPGSVPQPEETRAGALFTQRRFARDTAGTDDSEFMEEGAGGSEGEDDEDFYHANSEYGRLALPRLLAAARAAVSGGSPVIVKATTATDTRKHPYSELPSRSFWNRAVAGRDALAIEDWYTRKFALDDAAIATAGSCFAQHIGKRLRSSGFRFIDTEPAPASLPASEHAAHGYGLYSARYGNVYTTRQLLQLFERAFGEFKPRERHWRKDDGFVDPFRPTIRPAPYATRDELEEDSARHLSAVRQMFEATDVFVFTLGLTETWASADDGAVYPVAPGVSGGAYDPARHRFLNLGMIEVLQDLKTFIDKALSLRSGMRFLLTVSPVPLMATATGDHVVNATTWSKSVLRAVAGQLAMKRRNVDYFPSFEIINSHVMAARFYDEDKRSVLEAGVDHVMQQFFREHRPPTGTLSVPDDDQDDDVVCDEMLLAAFDGQPRKQ